MKRARLRVLGNGQVGAYFLVRVERGSVREPLRLLRRQPQSGHFAILALNSSQYVVKRLLCCHGSLRFPGS